MPSVMWFRRDLRLNDNPALNAAIENARANGDGAVAAMVMIDDHLWPTWGAPKQQYLADSLTALSASLENNLIVRHGNPLTEVLAVAQAVGATQVHCAADFTTVGIERDAAVKSRLAEHGIELVVTGSIYAISPGRIFKGDGTPYKVYTPFYRAWLAHGWRRPAELPSDLTWCGAELSQGIPTVPEVAGMTVSAAGELAALERWELFRGTHLKDYNDVRDRADLDGTSRLSTHLKWGEVHPRTLLAEIGDSAGEDTFRKELAWREFYADVLFHNPHSMFDYLNPQFKDMQYDTGELAESRLAAWKTGTTGFPFVDAGMRQLAQEGWMHNRVRMVTASFLIKDLHIEWQVGAAWFFELLKDADYASNQHGWQWTAGCGTDAAPYFRIFNPITQGEKFDPLGDYVRKYIPELRHIPGKKVHQPWSVSDGYAHGYAAPIVDHSAEREESLRRYAAISKKNS